MRVSINRDARVCVRPPPSEVASVYALLIAPSYIAIPRDLVQVSIPTVRPPCR